ncbi:MAG: glycosyltransferase [Solirubrobacteraceae bacterium]
MKILIVSEYYPRAADPVRGIWAHRQAVAAREAGAEVRAIVLHRPLPSLISIRERDVATALHTVRQPAGAVLDGVQIDYVRYVSPPRPWSYGSWGAWAAPALGRALSRLRSTFAFDLVHAHYAVPAGDAARRAAPRVPLVVSVHGHDVHGRLARSTTVRATLAHARLVLANSAGTARRCMDQGAGATRVIHLGTEIPPTPPPRPKAPTLVTVANLVARKRQADVISAVALLGRLHPELRYVIVGDGPERERLRALAVTLGVERRVELRGQLSQSDAIAAAQSATLFVLPSVDEAFGVAYVEAMAAGVPAIGCHGEDGPREIAAMGAGIALVEPRNPPALARRIDELLRDPAALRAMEQQARATVRRDFTWERCGRETVQAYREVLES